MLGDPVRYDGRASTFAHELLYAWRAAGRIVPFCPEIAAGVQIPRLPAEIESGKAGAEVLQGQGAIFDSLETTSFLEGARLALDFARSQGCHFALLSPSCGVNFIYDGRFSGRRKAGMGVVSALLRRNGIQVSAPQKITELALVVNAAPPAN